MSIIAGCKTSRKESGARSGHCGRTSADKTGLHRAHVGELERGEGNVTLQTLKILADTLKVRIVDPVKGM